MVVGRQGVRELLGIYGAVDAAVGCSDRNEFRSAVDNFLPGYSTHCGWHTEIEHALFEDPRDQTDIEDCLTRIVEFDTDDKRLPQPQKARLLFALATITRLNQIDPGCPLPELTDGDHRDLTVRALAAAGPDSREHGARIDIANAQLDDLTEGVRRNFFGRSAFTALRKVALDKSVIGEQTALAPICDSAVVTVNGLDSVVVDSTLQSDRVSLTNLKAIVNPYNWNENYPQFFVAMDKYPGNEICPDGWRRVLESVDFFDGVKITTPLKYLPIAETPVSAMLEYDLDMSKFDAGDRRVLVDRGYINMTATNQAGDPNQNGVRVQTRKVVHITGISPFAQQRLVCITGYGTASSDFLLGPAQTPSSTAHPFEYPVSEDAADQADVDDPPVALHRHAVPAAVQVWNDTLMDVTGHYADLAQKWWTTGVSASDLAEFGGRVGSRLAAAPLTYLNSINRPRYRDSGGPS